MRAGSILFVGASVADVRSDCDQRRPVGFILGFDNRLLQRRQIVAVFNILNMPVIRFKTYDAVLRKSYIGVAFDGDVVVIVEVDQLAQTKVTGQ